MVSGGESSGYGLLTVRENLWMFSQFYGIPSTEANQRIKRLLEMVGLADRINTKSSDLSTGLRQKMNIVRGFLTDPEVLFLDEPTLGLDVGASPRCAPVCAAAGWTTDQTRTLLLTTHYMVEADELCDRVAIINKGRVLACDTPANLKQQLAAGSHFPACEISSAERLNALHSFAGTARGVHSVTHEPQDGCAVLELIAGRRDRPGRGGQHPDAAQTCSCCNLQKREPTLEDVFVDLVGRSMAEVEQEA